MIKSVTYWLTEREYPYKIYQSFYQRERLESNGFYRHQIHAMVEQYQKQIEYLKKTLCNTAKKERPPVRKRTRKIMRKIEILKRENPEYFL